MTESVQNVFSPSPDRLVAMLDALNAEVRPLGWIVSRIDARNSSELELTVLSNCGSVCITLSSSDIEEASWPKRTVDRMLQDDALRAWLDDVDFGHFTKSELFQALVTRIVVPTRLANLSHPLSCRNVVEGSRVSVALNTGVVVIAGILHSNDAVTNVTAIDEINGAFPDADEFHIWKGEEAVPSFNATNNVGLEEVLHQVHRAMEQIVDGDPTIILLESDWPGKPMGVSAGGLIELHHLAGGYVSLDWD